MFPNAMSRCWSLVELILRRRELIHKDSTNCEWSCDASTRANRPWTLINKQCQLKIGELPPQYRSSYHSTLESTALTAESFLLCLRLEIPAHLPSKPM